MKLPTMLSFNERGRGLYQGIPLCDWLLLWGAGIGARKLALAVVLIRRSCSRFEIWDFKLEIGRVVIGLRPFSPVRRERSSPNLVDNAWLRPVSLVNTKADAAVWFV